MADAGPSAQSVGREFVRQYYTMLNERPDCLHRFVSQCIILFFFFHVTLGCLPENSLTNQLAVSQVADQSTRWLVKSQTKEFFESHRKATLYLITKPNHIPSPKFHIEYYQCTNSMVSWKSEHSAILYAKFSITHFGELTSPQLERELVCWWIVCLLLGLLFSCLN